MVGVPASSSPPQAPADAASTSAAATAVSLLPPLRLRSRVTTAAHRIMLRASSPADATGGGTLPAAAVR
jgi:hypothetical protein